MAAALLHRKPGYIATFAVLVLLISVEPILAQSQWTKAVLLDFDSATFYVSYSGTAAPTSTEVQLQCDGSVTKDYFNIAEVDDNGDGYLQCYSQHKVCEVVLNVLVAPKNYEFRTWANVEVLFRITSSDGPVTAQYGGRNLLWPGSSVPSDSSLTDFSTMAATFGGIDPENLGAYIPISMNAYVSGGNLVGLEVNLMNENDQTITQLLGDTNSVSPEATDSIVTPITSVVLYLSSATTGAVCGMRIQHGGGNDIVHGCSTSTSQQTYSIDSNYAFAGFTSLQTSSGTGEFILYPIQYQLLDPRIVRWEATDTQINFMYKIFWRTSQIQFNINSRSLRSAADPSVLEFDTSSASETVVADDFPRIGSSSVSQNLLPCSPTRIEIQSTNDLNRKFLAQEYVAWTYGYEVTDTRTTTIEDPAGGEAFSSKPYYGSSLALDQQCDEIFPTSFALTTDELYVNGYHLGSDELFTGTPVSLAGKFINKVHVFYDTSTSNLIGLTLAWDNYNYTTLGSDTAANSDTFDFSTTSGSPRVLWSIDTVYGNSGTQKLTFNWARAREPVLIATHSVNDGSGYRSTYFQAGLDAHLKKFYWYNPVGYSKVQLTITGNFLNGAQSTYTTTFDQAQTRAQDESALLYQLVAGTSYSYSMKGVIEYSPDVSEPTVQVETSATTSANFITDTGVQIDCTTQGQMPLQVNFEALPEVGVLTNNPGTNTDVDMGNAAALVVETKTAANVQNQWLKDAHFTYQDSPINPDFLGYPIGIRVYWNEGDDCIRGLALVFTDRDAVNSNTWLSGSQIGFDSSNSANKAETIWTWSNTDTSSAKLIAAVNYVTSANCLAGIQFRNTLDSD